MIPYRSVHFIGVLTPEMASLAVYTAAHGIKVTASDDHTDSCYLPSLLGAGITFFDMFAQTNITKTLDIVIVSRYYDVRHTEAVTAAKEKITVMTETEFLKEITDARQRVAILGEYEGPIIASWLSHVWNQAHLPAQALTHTVALGAYPSLAAVNESDTFIIPFSGFKRDAVTYEADFLSFTANMVVIPSIRYDYPELNTTLDDVYNSYYTFVKRIPRTGLVIGNSDYQRMKRLRLSLADRHFETYGLERDAAWHIREVSVADGKTTFSLAYDKQLYGPLVIPCQGETYVYAAAAVVIHSLLRDLKLETIARGLETVPQFKRYFHVEHDREGRVMIDDRADHPETIRGVLENVRARFPGKKIWCLYQPGSFLRTKALAHELQSALSLADFVYLTDIKGYPREKSEGMHIRHFIAEMKQTHPQTYYFDESVNMGGLLSDRVASTDCIVTLGHEGLCQSAMQPLLAVPDEG